MGTWSRGQEELFVLLLRRQSAGAVWSRFHGSEGKQGVEEEWRSLKECVTRTAEIELEIEKREGKKDWYDEKCEQMVDEKVEARLKWIRTNNEEDREEYQRRRRICNRAIRKAKRECIDRRIKEQNKVFKGKVRGIKMKDGRLAEQEDRYRQVWTDHFMELLNDTSQSGSEVIEIDENEGDKTSRN
ncbi:hypothetical protein QE152_g7497 [Popillia japonica]|uniref:Uncharacterized protein n=1 Tax=Popillia japonica TaxID=7064 RepID=A0AAW1MDX6_POPJA